MGETITPPSQGQQLAVTMEDLDRVQRSITTLLPPVGSMLAWCGNVASLSGLQEITPYWLFCNGATYKRTMWPELYAAIGAKYATGGEPEDESRLPNLVGRAPYGRASSGVFQNISFGDATQVTLSIANLPPHGHNVTVNTDGFHQHNVRFDTLNAPGPFANVGYLYTIKHDGAIVYGAPQSASGAAEGAGSHGHSASASNTGSGTPLSIVGPYQVVEGWIIFAGVKELGTFV